MKTSFDIPRSFVCDTWQYTFLTDTKAETIESYWGYLRHRDDTENNY